MISFDCMKTRVIYCLAQRSGKATKAEIIQNTQGKKARLIRTIDHLVVAGKIMQEGSGRKGNPHIFTLRDVQLANSLENQGQYITVTI